MSKMPPYFTCWDSIPEDAAPHLKEKLSTFHIFREPRYFLLSASEALEWANEGKISKPMQFSWTPKDEPLFKGHALVVQREHAACTDSGLGIFATTHQRILDMAEAFMCAWAIQQKRVEELLPKPKVKVEKPFYRTCQECGHIQRDIDPATIKSKAEDDEYTERKCRRCKSHSLDWGSSSDPRKSIAIDPYEGEEYADA